MDMLLANLDLMVAASAPAVQLDQVGYTPGEAKWAAVPHAVGLLMQG